MPSPVDTFYQAVFGSLPTKDGAAYEQLAAIALHVLSPGTVKHDARLRGEFSRTIYQIDALHSTAGGSSMAEAKDYSARDGKVGRGDLQKLGGALPDIADVGSGAFFSATGYTGPARKYAEQASNIVGKPINLFELRPSFTKDEDGFIRTIVIQLHILRPLTHAAKFEPVFTEEGRQALRALYDAGSIPETHSMRLESFLDSSGAQKLSLYELTMSGYADPDPVSLISKGSFSLDGLFIKVGTGLIGVERLEYEMPYETEVRVLTIGGEDEPKLTLADGAGTILRLLPQSLLRQYKFDAEGNLMASANER